jgi:probable HAF family extracellular repeat protein
MNIQQRKTPGLPSRIRFFTIFTMGLTVVAWMQAEARGQSCCTAGGIFGSGRDGSVVIYQDTTLTRDMEYVDLTLNGATLNTAGYTIRVCGRLENWGTITDFVSGGLGGGSGVGGLGANPNQDRVPDGCPDQPSKCSPGGPGLPGQDALISQAGRGGDGGAGGGGGGGASYNGHDANGSNGAAGGTGGRGGGYVRIFCYQLENVGLIRANGEDGAPGESAPDCTSDCAAEYDDWWDGPYHRDIAGGGGGGGNGGDGGHGGTVEIHYGDLIFTGILEAKGGSGGSGGLGGDSGTTCAGHLLNWGAPCSPNEGCPNGEDPPNISGGAAACAQYGSSDDGVTGADGEPGDGGSIELIPVFNDCNSNGIADECDIADGFSEDCNINGRPDDCDITLGFSEDCNGNDIPDECELRYAVFDLDTLGGDESKAFGLNDAGEVVGWADTGDEDPPGTPIYHAFLWLPIARDGLAGGMNDLGVVSGHGPNSIAFAINNGGTVVGASGEPTEIPFVPCSGTCAFQWTVGAGMVELPPIEAPPYDCSYAYALSSFDVVAGWSQHHMIVMPGGTHIYSSRAAAWLPSAQCGLLSGLNNLGEQYAYGINDLGDIVGDFSSGIIRTCDGTIHDPFEGTAYDINNMGQAVGWRSGDPQQSAVLCDTDTQMLETLGAGWPYSINDNRQVVGMSNTGHATLWIMGATGWIGVDLNSLIPQDAGWVLESAKGINDAGQIVGYGTHIGVQRAFLLDPDLGRDCNGNGILDICEIAAGRCRDCNENGLPDECDVPPLGTGEDCNSNGVPDECELFCNDWDGNGIPDECDILNDPELDSFPQNGFLDDCDLDDCNANGIADWCDIHCDAPGGFCDIPECGLSQDCNQNGVPDECDVAAGLSGDCKTEDLNLDGIPDECNGDVNCDFAIDGLDIPHFVQALTAPADYEAQHDGDPYPPCSITRADANADGQVNTDDITAFVEILLVDR